MQNNIIRQHGMLLVVEDNQNDAELILRSLRKHNLANGIQVVKDGEEALDYVFCRGAYALRRNDDRPKLILLDLKLPKVSGLEVLKHIKQDDRTKTIPVVILTSSGEEIDLKEAYLLGVNSYVTKPLVFGDFARVVSDLGLYWLIINKVPEKS